MTKMENVNFNSSYKQKADDLDRLMLVREKMLISKCDEKIQLLTLIPS